MEKKKIIESKVWQEKKILIQSTVCIVTNFSFSLVFTQFSSFTSFKNKIKNLNQILKSLYPYAHSRIKAIL